MNERIKELAEQAANEIADLFSPGFFDDRMVNDVAEINKKFAELIVRECDRYVAEQYDESEPWMQPGDLLKHFGVKQ